jgi:hypothetical protein
MESNSEAQNENPIFGKLYEEIFKEIFKHFDAYTLCRIARGNSNWYIVLNSSVSKRFYQLSSLDDLYTIIADLTNFHKMEETIYI